ncbi:MAG: Fic family protein [Gemmatimonadales bacterium]|nr:Fic family protein [Gemmatimonadales bacterium]MDZ4390408.1 Fic family protein [Gemmatimonadales bacterium]
MLAAGLPASPELARDEVVGFARHVKRGDVYHSTVIEGYRVTTEDLDALFLGSPIEAATREDVERQLALRGYADAFDRVLDRLPTANEPWMWSTDHILDSYVDLWTPSAEANGLALGELRSFRSRAAYLQGTRYVPPPPGKLWDLLEGLEHFLATTEMPGAARAALGHWGFETIHPLPDGNGRVGRLLMNACLGAEGYPWVTIQASDRARYFGALETGHVDDDLGAWAAFFGEQLERALREADIGEPGRR